MAVATTPYQNNDYQAANTFRPHRLPVNDIFRGLAAQNLFWEQGAARVKNVYESALNLNLTLNENKEIRDNYIKEAEKQMTKLSAKNLSDSSVQKEGMSLFDNLLRDPAIVQDDYLTKKYKSVLSDAERFKNDPKTKGAGFHLDNLRYALMPFEGFSENTSRDQLGSIFGKAKNASYTPYYDVGKERLDILDKCKGNKASGTVDDGPYLRTNSDKSLYESKLYGCLEGGMSDQARQQIRISGAARYNGDLNALRNDYVATAQERKSHYDNEKSELLAKRAALQKVKGNEQSIADIDEQIKGYDEGLKKVNTDLTSYNLWDEKYMTDNYEDLAYAAYHKVANGAFAAAFAFQDIEKDMKSNPIWMTTFTQNSIDRRTIAGFDHDEAMSNLDFEHDISKLGTEYQYKMGLEMLKGTDENGKALDPISSLRAMAGMGKGGDFGKFMTQATEAEGTSSGELMKQIQSANTFEQVTAKEVIKQALSNPDLSDAISQLGIKADANTTADQYKQLWRVINTYKDNALKTDPNDPTALKFQDAENALIKNSNFRTMWKTIYDDAKNSISPEVLNNFNNLTNELIKKAKPFKLNNGTVIQPDRLKAILAGDDPEFIATDQQKISSTSGVVKGDSSMSSKGTILGSKGNIVDRRTGNIVGASDIAGTFLSNLNKRNANITDAMEKSISQNTVMQRMGLATGNLFGKGSVANRDIETWFGNSLGVIGKDVTFNAVGPLDPVTGKVRIQATNKEGERISSSDLMSAIAEQGKGTSPGNLDYSTINDNTIEVTLPSAVGIISQPTYGDAIRQVITWFENKAKTNPSSIPATGVTHQIGRSPRGTQFSLKVNKKIGSNDLDYTILHNGKEFAVPQMTGNTKEDAVNQLNTLLEGLLNK